MKKKITKLLSCFMIMALLLELMPQTAEAAASKTAVYYSGNGHYYYLFNKSKTWSKANTYCASLGGYLATITSQQEEDFIEDLLVSNATKNYFWLGGTDEESEGTWKWVTGESWGYTNWHDG